METELAKYVAVHGQTETSRRVGLTQGAIWQMLKSARNILVIERDGHTFLEERKRIKKNEVA